MLSTVCENAHSLVSDLRVGQGKEREVGKAREEDHVAVSKRLRARQVLCPGNGRREPNEIMRLVGDGEQDGRRTRTSSVSR